MLLAVASVIYLRAKVYTAYAVYSLQIFSALLKCCNYRKKLTALILSGSLLEIYRQSSGLKNEQLARARYAMRGLDDFLYTKSTTSQNAQ